VAITFEKETKRKETVLFHIRLDINLMNNKTGWPADIKRTRNIDDFKLWKDHDAYQKNLYRLLSDLKQES
jgi:hypothetical protein